MRSRSILPIAALLIAGVAIGGWLIARANRSPAGSVEQSTRVGDVRMTLRVDGTTIGSRVIDVLLRDAVGKPVDVGTVRLRFMMVDMDMGNAVVDAPRVGAGHFQARGQFFTMAGTWVVEASLLRDGQEPIATPFTIAMAAPGELSGPTNPYQVNTQSILAGQKLYLANCVPCHGASGKGDGPAGVGLNPRPGDFTQHMTPGKHAEGQVFLWIKNGYPNSAMPAWGQRFNDEQIWQLVGYLRTFAQSTQIAQSSPAGATAQPQQPAMVVPNAQEPLPPIIFIRQSNVWRSPGNGGAPQVITNFQGGAYAEYPTLSPDGGKIAFVVITPAPPTAAQPLPSSILYTMNTDGSNQSVIWKPDEGVLGMPTWSADGGSLYIAANGVKLPQTGPANPTAPGLRVIRLDLASGAKQSLLENALDPMLSRDGTQFAYLKLSEDGYTMALQVAAPDGTGSRELIGGKDFQGFYAPRFSPDGKRIVVAAIGGPPTDQQGNVVKASAPSPIDRLLGLFEPPTAEAHGLPWDLWTVNTDGTSLRRITQFYEDLPMASFSPDGKQIVVMGLGGIYLMNADGSQLRRIDQVGDHGGLDWSGK